MNSYASLLGSVQVQRGVGSSTNGDGAFGVSISMATAAPSLTPMAEVTGSYGTYNTYNTGVSFATGLMGNHLVLTVLIMRLPQMAISTEQTADPALTMVD